MGKIFSNEVTDKELISKIHKHFIQLFIEETKIIIKNDQKI